MAKHSLMNRLNKAWVEHAHGQMRRVIEDGGAYVKSIECSGIRASVFTIHPDRALTALRAAGYGDWCGTTASSADRVDVECMDVFRLI